MKTTSRTACWCLASALLLLVAAHAGEPLAAPGPVSGHVLLLTNESVLEGDIERSGNEYRLKRQYGETRVPARQVLRLCQDLQEAYVFLKERTHPRDPDDRLRLAQWCQFHRLRKQALEEAMAATELRPGDVRIARLIKGLQQPVPVAVAQQPEGYEGVQSVGQGVDVSVDVLSLFATRVQPILMNTCAGCHSFGRSGFRLTPTYEGKITNRRGTQQNLAAALAQIKKDNWRESPLLKMSVTIHGDIDRAPIKDRQAPPYQNLEEWVRLVVGDPKPKETTVSIPEACRQLAPGVAPEQVDLTMRFLNPRTPPKESDGSGTWATGHEEKSATGTKPSHKVAASSRDSIMKFLDPTALYRSGRSDQK